MPLRALPRIEFRIHGGDEMGGGREIVVDLLVAGLAGISANVKGGVSWPGTAFALFRVGCFLRWRGVFLSWFSAENRR
jgi:hypothetical protein